MVSYVPDPEFNCEIRFRQGAIKRKCTPHLPDFWCFILIAHRTGAVLARAQTLLAHADWHLRSLVSYSEMDRSDCMLNCGGQVPLRLCETPPTPFQRVPRSRAVQVTFPNGVFSGTIISSVIKNADIKATAEWQLLLGAIALPGTYCTRIRNSFN